jgi:ABC-type Mn2+/Zn2+ transport system permease subunit
MGFLYGLGMALFFGVSLKLVIGAAAFGIIAAALLARSVRRTRSSDSSRGSWRPE